MVCCFSSKESLFQDAMRNRRCHVILSAAKNLWPHARLEEDRQILSAAKNDMGEPIWNAMIIVRSSQWIISRNSDSARIAGNR